MKKVVQRGVSKAEWLEAALELLAHKDITGLKIETLARSLGIAKSGFYWHFKNRQDLLSQMLDHWQHEITEVISENITVIDLEPVSRLKKIAEMILDYDLNRYEIPIRQWASQDAEAARAVENVDSIRLNFLRTTFDELGLEGDDLEMRTMLFVGYHASEEYMFTVLPKEKRRELIGKRIELLISK